VIFHFGNDAGIFGHGCQCSEIGGINTSGGGVNTFDILDVLCREWRLARKCTALEEGACHNDLTEEYNVESFNCGEGPETCAGAICSIDMKYVELTNTLTVSPFTPNPPTFALCPLSAFNLNARKCCGIAPELQAYGDTQTCISDNVFTFITPSQNNLVKTVDVLEHYILSFNIRINSFGTQTANRNIVRIGDTVGESLPTISFKAGSDSILVVETSTCGQPGTTITNDITTGWQDDGAWHHFQMHVNYGSFADKQSDNLQMEVFIDEVSVGVFAVHSCIALSRTINPTGVIMPLFISDPFDESAGVDIANFRYIEHPDGHEFMYVNLVAHYVLSFNIAFNDIGSSSKSQGLLHIGDSDFERFPFIKLHPANKSPGPGMRLDVKTSSCGGGQKVSKKIDTDWLADGTVHSFLMHVNSEPIGGDPTKVNGQMEIIIDGVSKGVFSGKSCNSGESMPLYLFSPYAPAHASLDATYTNVQYIPQTEPHPI